MIHIIEQVEDTDESHLEQSPTGVVSGFLFPEVEEDLTRLAEIKAAADEAAACDWRSLFHGLISILTTLSVQIQQTQQTHADIQDEIQSLKTDRQLIGTLQEESRRLREEFHEREVLKPIILAIISVADRCQDEIKSLQKMLKCYANEASIDVALAIRHCVNGRKADLAELEQLVISLGVEIYQNPESTFNPPLQTPIVVHTDRPKLANSIAARMRPGYRRGTLMIRKEVVKVFVHRESHAKHEQGD